METKHIVYGAVALATVGGIAYALSRGPTSKASVPAGEGGSGLPEGLPVPEPDKSWNVNNWADALPLPTAGEVQAAYPSVAASDFETNWGKTPGELRPLFLLAEQASGIRGAGRILALIARRESAFSTTAHNDSAGEVKASTNAYFNNKANRPALTYGVNAAAFGSGGLFGLLAPYLLWTGINEVKDKAPLLTGEPQVMYFPRVAAFGGLAYMQRILRNYSVKDIPEIKVGWASPSLLTEKGRASETYAAVRARFATDVAKLEINLEQLPPIAQLRDDAKNAWPGVLAVFDKVAGTLPVRKVFA
jgi:hypothetical protein